MRYGDEELGNHNNVGRGHKIEAIADDLWRDEYQSKQAHKKHVQEHIRLQEFYILFHAESIIVTAASSMVKSLRYLRPALILMDEASQLHEHTAVAVISRLFHRCEKAILIGDEKQLSTFVHPGHELVKTTDKSLMSRLRNTGVPSATLQVQYRMHAHISHCVRKRIQLSH